MLRGIFSREKNGTTTLATTLLYCMYTEIRSGSWLVVKVDKRQDGNTYDMLMVLMSSM